MVGVVADEYVVVYHGDRGSKNVRIGNEAVFFLQRGIDIGGFFDYGIGYREDVIERAKRLKSADLPGGFLGLESFQDLIFRDGRDGDIPMLTDICGCLRGYPLMSFK